MALTTLRLNHLPSSHPNDRVIFIKPLKRPPERQHEYLRAEKILKAVAAQALPIMKEDHLQVTTLEEHEPNREFVGRNWNHGETVELCLQSLSGAWLSLRMVEGVFMHELAHCKVMSHSQAFWKLRNRYCSHLKDLWSKGYTGDGFWSAGRVIGDLEQDMAGNIAPTQEVEGLEICGGTFRSRRKKRKVKDESTWKDKRDKRIEKKFGKNGEALGADEDKAMMLAFKTKGPLGTKSRVAQSKRGRELRAAAALARFSSNKKEVEQVEAAKTEEESTEGEEEYEEVDPGQSDAIDSTGCVILDAKGQRVVRASDEDSGSTEDRRREIEDFAEFMSTETISSQRCGTESTKRQHVTTDEVSTADDSASKRLEASNTAAGSNVQTSRTSLSPTPVADSPVAASPANHLPITVPGACVVCSMINEPLQPTCVACAHVLDVRKDSRAWKCQSKTCKDSIYVNSGDVGICGICAERKQSTATEAQPAQPPRPVAGASSHIAYL